MDVELPDGTIIEGVPEGMTQSELLDRVSRFRQNEGTATDATATAFTNRAGNNLIGIPDAILTGLANAVASPRSIAAPILGGDFSDRTLFEDITGSPPPAVGTRILPTPSVQDIRSFFGGPSVEEQQRKAAQFPNATAAGEFLGDAATLFLGRAPGVKRRAQSTALVPVRAELPAGTRRLFDRAFRSKSVQRLGRAARRSGETGIEAATISVLNGGDPAETAAWAMGMQAVGSGSLAILPRSGKGVLGFFAAGMAGATLLQLAKSATPGGQDSFVDSVNSSFDKLKWALVAGVSAGALGLGRKGGKLAQDVPLLADALTAIPRGAAISFISDQTKDKRIEPVVNKMVSDPKFFTPDEYRRLGRALQSEKISVSEMLDRMSRDKAFAKKVLEITPK